MLTQARFLAAADSISRAGEEGKLQSTMAEAVRLAPRKGRPDFLLNESLRMPGQVVGEVTAVERFDDRGICFTMTYPSESGGMSNKHGEAFYPLARNRTGALPLGPAAGRVTNRKIGVPAAVQDQHRVNAELLPQHILTALPKGLKPG